MLEGEIIKFYRETAGLTQAQLGEGICTATHVSKIERGKTAYSADIISLFSERLGIDIQKEIESLKGIDKQLQNWHTAIIMQRKNVVEKIKKELEASPFIDSSKYAAHYQLLKARYYILHQEGEKANSIIKDIQKQHPNLTPYERNLLHHIQGIYYLNNYNNSNSEHQQKAIQVLKEINIDEYGNPEYYYHLAVAYHCIDSKVMAYRYADKALRYFKKTNNFLRAINAESVMLLQIGSDVYLDFQEMVERYENLIHDSEMLGALDKKGLLLNNLGNEYKKRKEYALAKKYFKQALSIEAETPISYLKRLSNYVDTCLEGKLSRKTTLLKKAKEGCSLAKQLDSKLYITLFKLLIYRIENNMEQYYSFIEEKALPQFQSSKHVLCINRYGKELYEYYVDSDQHLKALQLSKLFMCSIS
ncbi:transcriptional regulator with XRE-family HTH domain [Bacillus pakistanensis]|uniref:Transcriptional regulator with XRE-family HTH domain n=1 Tax=Rossellomorea pakistanensis TaxID=992288 RepID=A0ABS2NJS0_9BACI|nr:helix-turn-helix domain-containing protein [Bacillus pakistanensis]MBM7588093.1 transcriptional regulator with XRE-family HTH domain [Bacillus pakistanensis]